MIQFKEAVEGYRAHWEVSEPVMVQLLVEQFENRRGLFVSVSVGPDILAAQELFHEGASVVVILPLGNWEMENSRTGNDYYKVTTLKSEFAGLRLNYILDGQTFPRWWAKYTKL